MVNEKLRAIAAEGRIELLQYIRDNEPVFLSELSILDGHNETTLKHVDIPVLEEAGWVEHDEQTGKITLVSEQELEVMVDAIELVTDNWSQSSYAL